MAMWPSAEAVRGWRRPNRSTVCTGARLRMGLGFYALKSVCARLMHTEVRFVEPVLAKLEGEKWRRPNFFIVWPIEVP
jgi:hypothetical protein